MDEPQPENEADVGERPSATGNSSPPPRRRQRRRPSVLYQEPNAVTWARERVGLSKRALAERIGISEQLMGEIESGWRSATPINLRKIAAALKCPIVALQAKGGDLVGGEGRGGRGSEDHAWRGSSVSEARRVLRLIGLIDVPDTQTLVWESWCTHGSNVADVAVKFGLLAAEVGEAFTAWRKGLPGLGEELVEILLHTSALAAINGVDLSAEVARKIEKDARRTRAADGTF